MSVPVCYALDERVAGVLGHAPMTGSPWEVRAYATTCTGIGTTVDELLPGLQAAAGLSADRCSEAIVALCERAEKVVGNLGKVRDRYRDMGSALDTYALAFDGAYSQSWAAHNQASTALDLIDTYAGQLRALARDSVVTTSTDSSGSVSLVFTPLRGCQERSKIDYDLDDPVQVNKAADLDDQWAVVDSAKNLMTGAWNDLETAAGALVTALKALHDDGLDDGWRENASGVGHYLNLDDIRTAVADAVKWFNAHLDDIATIVGIAALVLSVVPVVGQVLAVLAVALSAASLLNEAIAVVKDGKEWTAMIMPAVGILTFGVGRATTAAVKVTSAATKAGGTAGKVGSSADDAGRAVTAAAGRSAEGPASAVQAARQSLRPSAVWDDIVAEGVQMRAEGMTKFSTWVKPSNLVPEGLKFTSNGMVTPGFQLSNSAGLTASWNIANFNFDAVNTLGGLHTLGDGD
ncbi:MAG: hypothetical protein LBU50_02865 [Cellulomonas sp.]|jgi:hypothetical protein|nr:hypothetical protein [Cellulomonas sp.]